jgi:hypothetical protein
VKLAMHSPTTNRSYPTMQDAPALIRYCMHISAPYRLALTNHLHFPRYLSPCPSAFATQSLRLN